MMWSNKSLQATRVGVSSSASRFTSFGPACLSSSREAASHVMRSSRFIWFGLLLILSAGTASAQVSLDFVPHRGPGMPDHAALIPLALDPRQGLALQLNENQPVQKR